MSGILEEGVEHFSAAVRNNQFEGSFFDSLMTEVSVGWPDTASVTDD